MNEILHRNKTESSPKLKSSNNIPACELLNNHFVNIGRNISANAQTTQTTVDSFTDHPANVSLYLANTSDLEIENSVKMMKIPASGYDEIPVKVLKYVITIISPVLTFIINLSFRTGIFPDKLKIARVTPIFKSGDPNDVNNFRPVSVLSILSKIFERAMCTRLTAFLNDNKLLSPNQHGFLQSRSTETALFSFTKTVNRCLENKEHTIGVFLDFSKAFDSLDHAVLIKKLENIGVRGMPLKLFKSYLVNRKQMVTYNKLTSSLQTISTGVPQGSILGPLLFLIYINDICNVSRKLSYVLFADDTNIIMSHRNLPQLFTILNEELSKLNEWVTANKLKLNFDKTHYVYFKRRKTNTNLPNLYIGNKEIIRSHTTKFLGIIIDENLGWKEHINSICIKLSRLCGIIYHTRHMLTPDALKSVYYSLVYPHLTYGVVAWGNTYQTFKKPLQVIQKRIIRTITFTNRYSSTRTIFASLRLMKVDEMYSYFATLFVFKSINNFNRFTDFEVFNHDHNTRGQHVNMAVPRSTTVHAQRHILYSGPVLWNDLPPRLKQITNLNSFKYNLKKKYLTTTNDMQSTN